MNRNVFKYFFKGGIWVLVGRVYSSMLALALVAILTRNLSQSDMGVYFLSLSLANFLALLAQAGLPDTLLRFISEAFGKKQEDRVRYTVVQGLLIAAIISLVVASIFYFGVGKWLAITLFRSKALAQVVGWIAIWMILLTIQKLFSEIFRAFQDIPGAVLFGGGVTVTLSVIFLTLGWLWNAIHTLSAVFPLILTAGSINAFVSILWLQKRMNILPSKKAVHPKIYGKLIRHSIPLLINTLTLFVMMQADIWILKIYYPNSEVAIYGAAARLMLLTALPLAMLNALVPPIIARMNVQGRKVELEKILRQTNTWVAVPALMILAMFMIGGGALMKLLFGDGYQQGGTILILLSIGNAVNVLSGSCGYVLVMTGHRKAMMFISIISASVSVFGALLLVRNFGKEGVAFAVMTANIVQQILMLLTAKSLSGIWTHFSIREFVKIPKITIELIQMRKKEQWLEKLISLL